MASGDLSLPIEPSPIKTAVRHAACQPYFGKINSQERAGLVLKHRVDAGDERLARRDRNPKDANIQGSSAHMFMKYGMFSAL